MASSGNPQSDSRSGSDIVPQLIVQARGGSRSALGELAEHYRRYLQVLTARKLPADLQAKISPSDVVQDTLIDAFRGFGQFGGQTRFELRAWLRQILVHNLADVSRQYRETAKRQVAREETITGGDDSRPAQNDPACWDTPSAHAICREVTQQVERALAEMPDDYRRAILLRSRDRLSFAEVGTQLNRSAEAARKLWATAILRLQQRLENPDERRRGR
jgi:RNA polymerase sigma-70 factor, ECF subfamily